MFNKGLQHLLLETLISIYPWVVSPPDICSLWCDTMDSHQKYRKQLTDKEDTWITYLWMFHHFPFWMLFKNTCIIKTTCILHLHYHISTYTNFLFIYWCFLEPFSVHAWHTHDSTEIFRIRIFIHAQLSFKKFFYFPKLQVDVPTVIENKTIRRMESWLRKL